MGLEPILSGDRSEDEGLFVRQHEYWAKTLISALDKDGGGDGGSAVRHVDRLRVAA
jgi:benzoate/toluate 1,2-dioxygenase alpha subunit